MKNARRGVARALHTIATKLPSGDQLRIAAGWRFDQEYKSAGCSARVLAARWGVCVREAQRIVVLYRGRQR